MRGQTLLLSATLLLTLIAGCDANPDDPPPPNPAGDLRIVQQPNDTVRVGTTVRYTALFADSLKGYRVIWDMVDGKTLLGRSVEWKVPDVPGAYLNGVSVNAGVNLGTTSGTFFTVVIP